MAGCSLNSKQNGPKPFPLGAYIQKDKNKINKQNVQWADVCEGAKLTQEEGTGTGVAGHY